MPKLTAIIGRPGTGKTTIMRKFMEGREWKNVKFADLVYGHESADEKVCILGKYDDEGEVFAGTDRLSMAVQPAVLEWLKTNQKDVVFEGDRLTSQKFFDAVIEMGYELRIWVVYANEAVLNKRYEERGSNQNETFLNGRATKIANILGNFDYINYVVEFRNETTADQAELLRHLKDLHNFEN